MVTFPLWFKIFLAWFLLAMILEIVKYFARNKYAIKIMELSKEKRATILKSNLMIIKIYKIFFWASPIYLIIIPFLLYINQQSEFFHITAVLIVTYIIIFEDFLNRKFLVKKLKEGVVSPLNKKDSEENKILLSEGKKDEQQRLKTKKRIWIFYASLLPVFAGIVALSFFASKDSLNITSFAIISITTFCFSMASGYIESIRIKKFGITQRFGTTKRVVEFVLLQLVLFIWMNISIILLMEIFKQRYF